MLVELLPVELPLTGVALPACVLLGVDVGVLLVPAALAPLLEAGVAMTVLNGAGVVLPFIGVLLLDAGVVCAAFALLAVPVLPGDVGAGLLLGVRVLLGWVLLGAELVGTAVFAVCARAPATNASGRIKQEM